LRPVAPERGRVFEPIRAHCPALDSCIRQESGNLSGMPVGLRHLDPGKGGWVEGRFRLDGSRCFGKSKHCTPSLLTNEKWFFRVNPKIVLVYPRQPEAGQRTYITVIDRRYPYDTGTVAHNGQCASK